jgi:hypothetical protein
MRHNLEQTDMIRALARDFAARARPTVFVTVTLKQGIRNDAGSWTRITREDCDRTCLLLCQRLSKAIRHGRYGRKYRRSNRDPDLIPVVEGDGDLKRFHLHIDVEKPDEMPIEEFSALVHKIARKLDWVYHEIDVRPIETGTELNTLEYILKTGTESLCLGATRLRV